MPKFRVECAITLTVGFDVEAEEPEDAQKKVEGFTQFKIHSHDIFTKNHPLYVFKVTECR